MKVGIVKCLNYIYKRGGRKDKYTHQDGGKKLFPRRAIRTMKIFRLRLQNKKGLLLKP